MRVAKRDNIVKGTLILVTGNIIVKIIGALFKLPLANIVGADGMGLYNAAFIVYDIFLVLATAGFPLAVSKLVAASTAKGNDIEALKIFSVTRKCFFLLGLTLSIIMFCGARVFSALIGNTRTCYSIMVLAPSVLFVALMSSYRGYYQGTNDMIPTTVSQIIEAVCRLVVGLTFAVVLTIMRFEAQIVAAGSLAGITVGEFSSTFSLAMLHRHKMKKRRKFLHGRGGMNARQIIRRLFAVSGPIAVGVIVISVINMLDNTIVMRRLQYIGFSEYQANVLYGTYNMAFTVFSLPITVVSALQTSVFPILSYAYAEKNISRVSRISQASMRIALTVGIGSAALFLALSGPIVNIIYFKQPSAMTVVVPLLTLLAPSAIVFTLTMMTSTILFSIDCMATPTCSMIIGGIICLVCNWFLVGCKALGIYGAPIGIFICYSINALLNIKKIRRVKEISLCFRQIAIKPILPAVLLGTFGYLSYAFSLHFFGMIVSSLIGLTAGMLAFIAALFLNDCITRSDLMMLPGGKKLARIFSAIRLIPAGADRITP